MNVTRMPTAGRMIFAQPPLARCALLSALLALVGCASLGRLSPGRGRGDLTGLRQILTIAFASPQFQRR
jgi:hypothetical protein